MEEEKHIVCYGHDGPVTDLFYSSDTPDGFFVISASKDESPDSNLLLWDGKTGEWIGTFYGHSRYVWSCCMDKDALLAASASQDCSVRLWNALDGKELESFAHPRIVRACSFSEDSHLLTGGIEKMLRIFDLNHPKESVQELLTPDVIRTVAWFHNDKTVVSSKANGGGVSLWDIRSGEHIQTLQTESPVTSLEVSCDGRLITTTDGSTVSFWETNTFGLVKSHKMPFYVKSASLEPKYGNTFIVGGEDVRIHSYNFDSGEEITANDEGHYELPYEVPVNSVRFSPCGEFYASVSEDGTVRIWTTDPVKTGFPQFADYMDGW